LTPPACSGERLCSGTTSVRPSVCPVDRQQQRRAAGLLQPGRRRLISIESYRRRSILSSGQRHAVVRGRRIDADLFRLRSQNVSEFLKTNNLYIYIPRRDLPRRDRRRSHCRRNQIIRRLQNTRSVIDKAINRRYPISPPVRCCPLVGQFQYSPRCQIRAAPCRVVLNIRRFCPRRLVVTAECKRDVIRKTGNARHIAAPPGGDRAMGSESVPIQLAQRRFPGLAISNGKIYTINIFLKQNIRKQFYRTELGNCYGLKLPKYRLQFKK